MRVNGKLAPISHPSDPKSNFGQAQVYRSNGRIVIDAGAGHDRVDVRKMNDGRYHVGVNGQDFSFTRAEFAKVTLRGGAGNDAIRIDRNVDVPLRVEGGSGNDHISGFANRSHINGGIGNDYVAITGRDNFIRGGSGADTLRAYGDRNLLRGDFGNDSLYAYGWNNRAYGDAGWDEIARGVPSYRVAGRVLYSKVRG